MSTQPYMKKRQVKKQNNETMLRTKTLVDATLVGRAFRGPDGIIRWIMYLSSRKYYFCRWFDESGGVWHNGGSIKTTDWQGGEEVPAPRKGETYLLVGSTGLVSERIA